MIEDILRFYKTISRHQIELDTVFKEIVQDYSIFHISESSFPNDDEKQKITDKIKESQVVIIDQNQELNKKMQNKCFIIGFEKTLIIFEYSSKSESFLREFFSIHSQILTCDLSDQNNKMQIFRDEINEFKRFVYNRIYSQQAWKITSSCILGYLIKKSYLKLNQNRIEKFNSERDDQKEPEIFEKEEFVELRTVGNGSFALCKLVYHIKRQELFVVKKPNTNDVENDKLLKREIENYKKIKHPFLPKFYGTVKDKNYLVIEFINGSTLKKMSPDYLNFNEKITVIFELIFAMKYMHDNKFIYRDLKPNNVMIDENKTAVLIDFDRLISNENNEEIQEQTLDINADFLAPEVNVNRKFTYKSDIYSLGKIIKYIIGQKEDVASGSLFKSIIEKCTKENPEERPSISDLIDPKLFLEESQFSMSLTHILFDNLSLAANQNDPHAQFYLGLIYYEGLYVTQDINKSIHYYSLAANQNHPEAQFNLGVIYYEGLYVTRDINKSIHYLSLAADQNYPEAQFNLGVIYCEGLYVTQDINKSIHYFSLAANQNHPPAQFNLGLIYYSGLYVTRDINKSIHYLSLAANQNHPQAQFNLGLIYHKGRYVTRDINKSIHYLTLAANQNYPQAQSYLGLIYYSGRYVTRDISKSIHYLTLAANQNDPDAQFSLGLIYCEGRYVTRDINKSIHYFSLAADQNDPPAQFNLGLIYYEGRYVTRDINKAIHYFSLAADQNIPPAQFDLGVIYYEGQYVTRDINKSIHYYSLAADQNHSQAQFNLGLIYYEGLYVTQDINKSIHYLSLAANQNHPQAQFNLGLIYYSGLYVTRDINKSIHYLTLASNQNHLEAQFNLGVIYHEGLYVTRDINKSIHYLSLASNQNDPKAQFNLGLIYYSGRYVTRDINKSIHYLTLASNQNHPVAQFDLGVIYHEGLYVTQDINKSIHYLSLASNQNHLEAQFYLGLIYYEGRYVTRDISKSIHYFSLAANQNDPRAQFDLGVIYYEGRYVTRDISKSIHYLTLAADQNDPPAQFDLGVIYYEGRFVTRDINKSIHYLTLAANQYHPDAQFSLGLIYYSGRYVTRDINKSIQYLSLAANQNDPPAQSYLGLIYYSGRYVTRDINKSIQYLSLAANQNDPQAQFSLGLIYYEYQNIKQAQYYLIKASINQFRPAHFSHGFLLHSRKGATKDIHDAIRYYKEASSFNNQYAKNNLGIIYKNGFGDEVKARTGSAIEYFEEAIRQKRDYLSMYNLAHIYIYSDFIEHDIDKSINLLIRSSNKFHHSLILLSIILMKKYGNISNTIHEIKKLTDDIVIQSKVYITIMNINSGNGEILNYLYEFYRSRDFLYDIFYNPILSSNLQNKIYHENVERPYAKNISDLFYQGFGCDLIIE